MHQYKALLKKDWQVNWKIMLVPAWFLLATYTLTLVVLVSGYIKSGSVISVAFQTNLQHVDALIWTLHFSAAIGIGILASITSMQLMDIINQDHLKQCEIFHFSFPISLSKTLGTKLIFVMLGPFLLYLLLAAINCLVMNLATALLGFSDLALSFNALINSIPYVILFFLVFPPLCALFAGIFKKYGPISMLFSLAAIDTMLMIISKLYGVKQFSIISYYLAILSKPLAVSRAVMSGNISSMGLFSWSHLFSSDALIRVAISAVLILITYHFIKRRELA